MNMQAFEMAYAKFWFKNVENAVRRRLWLKLAKMLSNNVPLLEAIKSIESRRKAAGKEKEPQTIALGEWSRALKNGVRLSKALDGWVSIEEIMLISAGEHSGSIEDALKSTARIMEAKKQIVGAVVGGMTYPILVTAMAFAAIYLFGFKVVPAFQSVVHGDNWYGMARVVINISFFVQHWLWLVLLGLFATVIAFFVSLPRFDGPVRIKLDRYAPYSIYRITKGSAWLIATAALINAGMRIEMTLDELGKLGSVWLKNRLDACLAIMRSGINMGDALSRTGHEFPDREIIDDLCVYAALSGFNEALDILGREWLDESVEQIRAKMKVLFMLSIGFVGVVILIMVGGMMAMMFQVTQMQQMQMH